MGDSDNGSVPRKRKRMDSEDFEPIENLEEMICEDKSSEPELQWESEDEEVKSLTLGLKTYTLDPVDPEKAMLRQSSNASFVETNCWASNPRKNWYCDYVLNPPPSAEFADPKLDNPTNSGPRPGDRLYNADTARLRGPNNCKLSLLPLNLSKKEGSDLSKDQNSLTNVERSPGPDAKKSEDRDDQSNDNLDKSQERSQ